MTVAHKAFEVTKQRYNKKRDSQMFKSTKSRAKKVKEVLNEHFEPGRQDRSRLWCYRNHIRTQFGISERTFFRYLKTETEDNDAQTDPRQLSLF